MENGFAPSARGVRREFKYDSASCIDLANVNGRVPTGSRSSVKIASAIEYQATIWIPTIEAAGEVIDQGLIPRTGQGRGQFVHDPRAGCTARYSRAIEIAPAVEY